MSKDETLPQENNLDRLTQYNSQRYNSEVQTYLLGTTTHKPTRKHANLNSKTLTLFNSNSQQYPIHTYIFCSSEGTTTKSNYLSSVWSHPLYTLPNISQNSNFKIFYLIQFKFSKSTFFAVKQPQNRIFLV